jgi:hypothetical protein
MCRSAGDVWKKAAGWLSYVGSVLSVVSQLSNKEKKTMLRNEGKRLNRVRERKERQLGAKHKLRGETKGCKDVNLSSRQGKKYGLAAELGITSFSSHRYRKFGVPNPIEMTQESGRR